MRISLLMDCFDFRSVSDGTFLRRLKGLQHFELFLLCLNFSSLVLSLSPPPGFMLLIKANQRPDPKTTQKFESAVLVVLSPGHPLQSGFEANLSERKPSAV